MPIYSIDIEKLYENEYWTNRYLVNAANLGAAVPIGNSIVGTERNLHMTVVTFTKFRVSDNTPNTDVYDIVPINLQGLNTTSTEYLPLFNVLRMDAGVVGGGRPSRKYYRMPCTEGAQSNGTWTSGTLSSCLTILTPLLSQPIVDPQGQLWNSITIFPKVGMRQLRRGTKRKLNPVL